MFLIAGIQPKLKRLDPTPRACPHCGATQAVVQRQDHYFSLFFIPLIRVKTGTPYMYCPRCQGHSAPGQSPRPRRTGPVLEPGPATACPACGQPVEPGFRYCPHCGQRARA